MKSSIMNGTTATAVAAMLFSAASVSAFVLTTAPPRTNAMHLYSSVSLAHNNEHLPYFATVQEQVVQDKTDASAASATALSSQTLERSAPVASSTKAKPQLKTKKADTQTHKQGILSPIVLLAKQALGQDDLNKIRAKAISIHSDVIGAFVETSNSAVGQTVLKRMFQVADVDKNGLIDETELARIFRALGFDWLQDKQVSGILKRADLDDNGAVDVEEFLREAPKTLRTNLIKLAKKNGGELGLLV
ncbi:hypothetical protein MPSEU_000969900 [Mayamaea pseudoterrestris]|nr:hypothetical protein MPSEU_000969900 [Mayamaea pseudoterrestris]